MKKTLFTENQIIAMFKKHEHIKKKTFTVGN